jgi:type II secretory pathway pseudopilin PulG
VAALPLSWWLVGVLLAIVGPFAFRGYASTRRVQARQRAHTLLASLERAAATRSTLSVEHRAGLPEVPPTTKTSVGGQ